MSDFSGKTAITFGVFDLLHFWHFEFFRRIRELVGENGKFYVKLQIDESIAKDQPGCRSVYDFETRRKMIETLRTVDKAITYDAVGRRDSPHGRPLRQGRIRLFRGIRSGAA